VWEYLNTGAGLLVYSPVFAFIGAELLGSAVLLARLFYRAIHSRFLILCEIFSLIFCEIIVILRTSAAVCAKI
jgi:hypothetical protein